MGASILNQIAFKKESTWGTPVTPDIILPVHMTGGIVTNTDVQFLSALRGQLSKFYHAQQGNSTHEGEFEMDMFPDMIGYPLYLAMGDAVATVVGGETLVYEHAFSELETKPSITLEQKVGENVRRYAGAVASGFKITGKAGVPLTFTIPMKAKSSASASPVVAVPTDVVPFDFADVSFKFGGVEFCEVENFEVEYMNNQELLHTICEHDPAFKYVGGSEFKGKADLYLDSATLAKYQDYLDNTFQDFELIVDGAAIGNASTYNYYLTAKVFITSAATELTEDYNLLSIEFQAVYNTGDKLIDMTVRNLVPDYTV